MSRAEWVSTSRRLRHIFAPNSRRWTTTSWSSRADIQKESSSWPWVVTNPALPNSGRQLGVSFQTSFHWEPTHSDHAESARHLAAFRPAGAEARGQLAG